MLETIIAILVIAWALGVFFKVAGLLIHVLLIAALVILVVRLFRGARNHY